MSTIEGTTVFKNDIKIVKTWRKNDLRRLKLDLISSNCARIFSAEFSLFSLSIFAPDWVGRVQTQRHAQLTTKKTNTIVDLDFLNHSTRHSTFTQKLFHRPRDGRLSRDNVGIPDPQIPGFGTGTETKINWTVPVLKSVPLSRDSMWSKSLQVLSEVSFRFRFRINRCKENKLFFHY